MALYSSTRVLASQSAKLVLSLRSFGSATSSSLPPVKLTHVMKSLCESFPQRGSPYRFVAPNTRDPLPSPGEKSPVKYLLVHGTPSSPIPLQNIVGWHSSDVKYNEEKEEIEINPLYFKENPLFADLLHRTVADHFFDSPELRKKARETNSGWLNIIDTRSRYGRAVPSEDIFGAVSLNDGAMERGSYRRMPTHRLYTDEGIFMLDSYLDSKLSDAIANYKSSTGK